PVPESAVAAAVEAHGPLTAPQLRDLTGLAKKDVERELAALHHRLVLTSSHLVEQDRSWSALSHELLARKWSVPAQLPERDAARRELALLVLAHAGELTAADLAGALGWRQKEAAAILDDVAAGRDDDAGFRIWTRR